MFRCVELGCSWTLQYSLKNRNKHCVFCYYCTYILDWGGGGGVQYVVWTIENYVRLSRNKIKVEFIYKLQ